MTDTNVSSGTLLILGARAAWPRVFSGEVPCNPNVLAAAVRLAAAIDLGAHVYIDLDCNPNVVVLSVAVSPEQPKREVVRLSWAEWGDDGCACVALPGVRYAGISYSITRDPIGTLLIDAARSAVRNALMAETTRAEKERERPALRVVENDG